jgi:hypothetical protein
MTTLRLSPSQKKTLERAADVLERISGRRPSQGEAVEKLAEFALSHPALWAEGAREDPYDYAADPLFDMNIVFGGGKRSRKSVDDTLYGRD